MVQKDNQVFNQMGEEREVRFDIARVAEHVVFQTMAEVTPTLQYFVHNISLTPEEFDAARRAELLCRGLVGRISAIAELYGSEDMVSGVRMVTYNLTQFFTVLTDQMNETLGLKEKGEITFSLTEDSEPDASFDARRICMIVYHLVSNALEHGITQNKNIEIRCRNFKNKFELSVRDHGGGIPKEIQPHIFHRFLEDFSFKNQMLGMFPPQIKGLGLPLCRKLAKDMNGELVFKNYVSGARFTVVLPQVSAGLREVCVFQPDPALLERCMADLLLLYASRMIKEENK